MEQMTLPIRSQVPARKPVARKPVAQPTPASAPVQFSQQNLVTPPPSLSPPLSSCLSPPLSPPLTPPTPDMQYLYVPGEPNAQVYTGAKCTDGQYPAAPVYAVLPNQVGAPTYPETQNPIEQAIPSWPIYPGGLEYPNAPGYPFMPGMQYANVTTSTPSAAGVNHVPLANSSTPLHYVTMPTGAPITPGSQTMPYMQTSPGITMNTITPGLSPFSAATPPAAFNQHGSGPLGTPMTPLSPALSYTQPIQTTTNNTQPQAGINPLPAPPSIAPLPSKASSSTVAFHSANEDAFVSICTHCRTGIRFDTTYYECLLCNVSVCAACQGKHPRSHGQHSIVVSASRLSPTKSKFWQQRFCKSCRQSSSERYHCPQCQYDVCTDCGIHDRITLAVHPHRNFNLYMGHAAGANGAGVKEASASCSHAAETMHCELCMKVRPLFGTSYSCITCQARYGDSEILCETGCLQTAKERHGPDHKFIAISIQKLSDDVFAQWVKDPRKIIHCQKCPFTAKRFDSSVMRHEHPYFTLLVANKMAEAISYRMYRRCISKPIRSITPAPANIVSAPCDACLIEFPLASLKSCTSCVQEVPTTRTDLCSDCFPTFSSLHRHGAANFTVPVTGVVKARLLAAQQQRQEQVRKKKNANVVGGLFGIGFKLIGADILSDIGSAGDAAGAVAGAAAPSMSMPIPMPPDVFGGPVTDAASDPIQ